MPSFDFISEREFRESLESDFAEMRKAFDQAAWKSVQVLAGSIVEALLVDYLVSVPFAGRPAKSPLSMDLADAITLCRTEGVLSPRAADLCSVVRSYRNLIHPGRLVRLGEPSPTKESANIALSLVEMITDELAGTRRKMVGLTAEQLVSKIERDGDVLSIYKHLVLEANEQQRIRLLLELIPTSHARCDTDDYDGWRIADRLESAYEITLAAVSDEGKRKAAAHFVKVLREEDGTYVANFANAFFRAPALEYVTDNQRAMVRGYLLSRLETEVTSVTLKLVEFLPSHLDKEDAQRWVDPLLKAVLNAKEDADLRKKARVEIEWGALLGSTEFCQAVIKRLEVWIAHLNETGAIEKAKVVGDIRDGIIPF